MRTLFFEGVRQLVLCLLCTGMLLGPHPFNGTHAKPFPVAGEAKTEKKKVIPANPMLALHKFLKNSDIFNDYAPLHLSAEMRDFRSNLEHGWVRDSVTVKLRNITNMRSLITPEVYVEVLEHTVKALRLKYTLESWVVQFDSLSPQSLGALQVYFNNVYYPMLEVQREGRFLPPVVNLELGSILWPRAGFPADIVQDYNSMISNQIRGPASEGEESVAESSDEAKSERLIPYETEQGYLFQTSRAPEDVDTGFIVEAWNKFTSYFSDEAVIAADQQAAGAAYDAMVVEEMAGGGEAGQSGALDGDIFANWIGNEEIVEVHPEDFATSITPKMNERLKEFGEAVSGATGNHKEIGELIKKYKALKPPKKSRKVMSEAQKKAYKRSWEAYAKERDEILVKLNELEPRRGFWVGAQRKVAGPVASWALDRDIEFGEETNREKHEKTIAQFYAEAAKMTSLMIMLQEIEFYKHVLDDETPFPLKQIAPSCLADYEEFPDQVRYQHKTDEERMFHIENFLSNNGLILSQYEQSTNDEYNQFFLANSDRDMYDGNYSGMLPFDQLRTAQQGLRYTLKKDPAPSRSDMAQPYIISSWENLGVPAFDDIHNFLDVWSEMLYVAVPKLGGQHMEDFTEVTEIIVPPQRELSDDATEEESDAYWDAYIWGGNTKYLARRLEEADLDPEEWLRLVPREVFNKWQSNEVRIEFPPFHGPEGYKQWAMRVIYKAILAGDISDQELEDMCVTKSSGRRAGSKRKDTEFCKFAKNGVKKTLLSTLERFEESGPYVPASLTYSNNLRLHWGELRTLWDKLLAKGRGYRVEDEFPLVTDEWAFLKTQMPHNPWAMVRVSALLKLAELDEVVEEKVDDEKERRSHVKKRRGGTKPSKEATALYNYATTMRKALRALPVAKIDIPLVPMYANSVMKRGKIGWKFWAEENEKIFYKTWEGMEERLLRDNFHVLKLPMDMQAGEHGADLYSAFEVLQRNVLLDDKDVDGFIKGWRLEQHGVSTDEMRKMLEEQKDSRLTERFEVLQKIRQNPNDVELHKEVVDDYIAKNGASEDFVLPEHIALAFMQRNREYQYPLMYHLVQIGAKKRIEAISREMEEFCGLDPTDDEDWKNLMSASATAQESFNNLFQLDGIPPEAEKYYHKMDWRDKKDLQYVKWMIVGFVGLALAAAACASGVGSIGGCPATAAIWSAIMYSGAFTALGTTTGLFIHNSFQAWQERAERMRIGQTWQELGYSDQETVNKRKGRSWMGFAFEIATMGTMFVPIGLSFKMAGKFTTHALARNALKRSGMANKIDVGQTMKDVANVESSLYRLGLQKRPKIAESLEKTYKNFKYILAGPNKPGYFTRAWRRLSRVAARANQANVPDVTIEEVNKRVGIKFAEYFKNNKKQITKFVNHDVRLKHERIAKVIAKHDAAPEEKKAKYLKKLNKYFNQANKPPEINMYKELLEKERRVMQEFTEALSRGSTNVAEYVAKNAEDLAPVMSDFTFHWWRIFTNYPYYLMFMQGAPWAFANNIMMRGLTRRPAVKTIFAAREHLAKQVINRNSLDELGMEAMVAVANTFHILDSGQKVYAAELAELTARAADESLGAEAQTLARTEIRKIGIGWRQFRKEIATRIWEFNNPGGNPKQAVDEINRIARNVFEASTDEEIKEAHRLLQTDPGRLGRLFGNDWGSKWRKNEDIFNFEQYGESSDILLERLSKEWQDDPQNIKKFGHYVANLINHMRILSASGQKLHEVNPY